VAIAAPTRVEWILADLGILCAGGVVTPIHPSCGAADSAHVLGDSGAVVCFVDGEERLARVQRARERAPDLRLLVRFDGKGAGDTVTLVQLEEEGAAWDDAHPGAYEKRSEAVGPDDLASLLYTSGTTGPPRGVMLTHDNWVFQAESADRLGLLGPSDTHFLFLPLAHAFARVLEIASIRVACRTVVDGEVDGLIDTIQAVQPTFAGAMPRVFERIHAAIVADVHAAGPARSRVFDWALDVGARVSRLRQRHQEPRGLLALQYDLADRIVFADLRRRLGGRVRAFVSGGAPLSPEVATFFHAAGLLILEGYGLTETSAGAFLNRPERFRFGTVGQVLPGVEARLAADGEVLIRGRGLMRGYWNRPEETEEALRDGWLRTGDVGQFDEGGFLRITDRKKDILMTANGKHVAPQVIEGALKGRCPYLAHVVVLGDGRPCCVALLTLDPGAIAAWAREHDMPDDLGLLAADPAMQALVKAHVDALNQTLASHETIKKFAILPRELSQAEDELTPTGKAKRRVVEAHFQGVVEAMYGP
jgi:long-chain acyl-CoA synthetase